MSNILRSRSARIGAIIAFTLTAAMVIPAAPALAATGEGCPNEAVRSESNPNPTTGQPYSMGLPECRAYEMVSPLYKQALDAILGPYEPVAPDGDAVAFASLGAFAGFESLNGVTGNPYLSQRTDSSWLTQAATVPASVLGVPLPVREGGLDYSPDLSKAVTCGAPVGVPTPPAVACAVREGAGSWVATPTYSDLAPVAGGYSSVIEKSIGSSSDLSHVIFQAKIGVHLLPTDTDTYEGQSGQGGAASIYEIVGAGTGAPVLRLVNVDDAGNVIGPENATYVGGSYDEGTAYHAISEDGAKVFFTATPAGAGQVRTVYARVELPGEQYETLALSNPSPSQCTTCSATPQPATYQGASANGAKVFFTTTQQLVNADTDTTKDLYEYDFAKPVGERIVQVSGGGAGDPTLGSGANVQGVISVSSDGSHVYFVARGLLTTTSNGSGQGAQSGADNMYVFDTVTGGTKFVAQLCSGPEASGEDADLQCGTNLNALENVNNSGGPNPINDLPLWYIPAAESGSYPAQTTPDGEYLIFKTYAHLASADTNSGTAVYRYDFQTGELTWVSHAAPGFTAVNEGDEAQVGNRYPDLLESGDHADINDLKRQISEDGKDIVFTTSEQLQADDVNHAQDVYLWHDGTVSMISDGQDTAGADVSLSGLLGGSEPSLSASGSDIFISTHTALVGQDTDALGDVYDAKIDGGFPAPTPEPSCAGEACQGTPSAETTFGAPPSTTFTGGGNLTPGSTVSVFPPPTVTGKVSIGKHSVKGSTITLSVKVPAGGHISASGSDVATVKRSVSKSGTFALKLTLTKAGKTSLRKHHRLKLKIGVAFTPTSGQASAAAITITVKT